ncbi:MAG: lysylphosphatidylglycerol synthase transmembrane domain-containing protein [Myxococcota bacterium]|nr:lysylphosphatidylglycerol synthase transmembrane domain-containing protein [Myxococcota bacterium]MEC9390170.1 lysylphosphatidylglycerol synthase transmembrane domain-containing protein [Myxococcota bacterium]
MKGQHIRMAAAAFLSAIGVWWFVHDIAWSTVVAVLKTIRLEWVVLAAFTLLGEFLIRALRWAILLRPLGVRVRITDLWSATVIGAAVNTLIPLRAGEIAKPMVASRRTGLRLSTLFATNVMERVFDLLGLVSILVLMILLLPGTSGDDILVANLYRYGSWIGFGAFISMMVFFLLATRGVQARGAFERILAIAPEPARRPFLHLFDGFVMGLGSSKSRSSVVKAAALSVGMWLNGAVAIWCLFQAFRVDLPFAAACFTGVAIALTVALPQAPGFIGVFHVAIEKAMMLWGLPPHESKGFALVFWAVSFVPVTFVGLIAMWREGLSVRDVQQHAEE